MSEIKAARQLIQTLDSLNQAIRESGGATITYDRMAVMTLFDFIHQVAAPGGIRFHFQEQTCGPKETEGTEEDDKIEMSFPDSEPSHGNI